MSEIPDLFMIDTGDRGRYRSLIYVIQLDQLLLRFRKGTSDGEIDEILGNELTLMPAHDPPYGIDYLKASGKRWVRFAPLPDGQAIIEFARALMLAHEQLSFATPVYYIDGRGIRSATTPLPNEFMVQLDIPPEFNAEQELAFREEKRGNLAELGLSYNQVRSASLYGIEMFDLPKDADDPLNGFSVYEQIAALPGVKAVQFDWMRLQPYLDFPLTAPPNDKHWTDQSHLDQIRVRTAWEQTLGSANTVVAVIDGDFDVHHEDLRFVPKPDHFNAAQHAKGKVGNFNAGPFGFAHGTAIAGLIAALANNHKGVVGVAPRCPIMPLALEPVPTSEAAEDDDDSYESPFSSGRVTEAIKWAVQRGARVINLSLCTDYSEPLKLAIRDALDHDIVICAASGNYHTGETTFIDYPAKFVGVIAVGAVLPNRRRKRINDPGGPEWGSAFGTRLRVSAPGTYCWTTDETGAGGVNQHGESIVFDGKNQSVGPANGNYYALGNGTSTASALVAGCAALIRDRFPALTVEEVTLALSQSCRLPGGTLPGTTKAATGNPADVDFVPKWNNHVGFGCIDCGEALARAASIANIP
jgi:subtilisin family serine protease